MSGADFPKELIVGGGLGGKGSEIIAYRWRSPPDLFVDQESSSETPRNLNNVTLYTQLPFMCRGAWSMLPPEVHNIFFCLFCV